MAEGGAKTNSNNLPTSIPTISLPAPIYILFARVKAVEWVQSMFYGENMTVVHRDHNQASDNFPDWVIKTFAGYKTYAMTSLATLLTLTRLESADFSRQKQRCFNLTEAEVPKSLVEVRIVDGSPSHEADIVVVDWVRTNKKGFIDNPKRMCVALSRARIGTIMVGLGNKALLIWPLSHAIEYCQEHEAAVRRS
ncbi:uncharacterized protein FTOL_03452 [Fusarium torulosum]|uniref:DNA2/NAM7 helicase-like C-terminal domain-containing protein n=1 Tax=Fusarium torulosum TaxID=33205 RepID=A0AAE8M463_9HYPO|nr:uncharacterized protein FTOL_03452 [Fusarium torulosum]